MNKTLKQVRLITKSMRKNSHKVKKLYGFETQWVKVWMEFRKTFGDKKAIEWFKVAETFTEAYNLLRLGCDGGSVEVSESLFERFSFLGYRKHFEPAINENQDARYFIATDDFVENYHRSGGIWNYSY